MAIQQKLDAYYSHVATIRLCFCLKMASEAISEHLGAQLWVDIRDFEGNSAYAQYTSFTVGDSASKYTLSLSGYSGTAGDSLAYHSGYRFTTRDQDNDAWNSNCAQYYKGAWWYRSCYWSNLNGLYYTACFVRCDGVTACYTLKFTEMKLKQSDLLATDLCIHVKWMVMLMKICMIYR